MQSQNFKRTNWTNRRPLFQTETACKISLRNPNLCSAISPKCEISAPAPGYRHKLLRGLTGLETQAHVRVLPACHFSCWAQTSQHATSRKVKHVELRYLYVQELVQSGLIRLRKVLGTLNPADILTKHVGKDTLCRRLELWVSSPNNLCELANFN